MSNSLSALVLVVLLRIGAHTEPEPTQPATPPGPWHPYGIGASASPAPARCGAAPYRALDFLAGRWVVRAGDKPAGRSRIQPVLERCALLEDYNGGEGRSLTAFDAGLGIWTQDYIDVRGMTIRLSGVAGLDSILMRDSLRTLRAPSGNGERPTIGSRFSWTRAANEAGFRQRWWLSLDSGRTERLNFDGVYRLDPEPTDPSPPAAANCREAAPYRSLDHLLGTWEVLTSEGDRLGIAVLAARSGQCLIEERFTGPGGSRSYQHIAFLYFDRYVDRWFRVQVDNRGIIVRQSGGFDAGILTLTGTVGGTTPTSSTRMQWFMDGATGAQRWSLPLVDGRASSDVTLRWQKP